MIFLLQLTDEEMEKLFNEKNELIEEVESLHKMLEEMKER